MVDSIKKVTVLGSGRWGTAMAIYLSRKPELQVTLQCHHHYEYEQLLETDVAPNLPGFSCEKRIRFIHDLDESLEDADVVIISTPVAFLSSTLAGIKAMPEEAMIVGINKGIDRESLKTVPDIIKEYFPNNTIAHLGGPCFPEGLLSKSSPVAETIACADETEGAKLQKLFHSSSFRVYQSFDVRGVAFLGALKNVYAIIAGIADGMGMYEEATSVLVTRGLAEMKPFCEKMGINLDTLYGLTGLGDLALTCYSQKSSHNKNFGRKLGQGEKVSEILEGMGGTVAEGYYTTKAIHDLATKLELEMPLCNVAYQVVYAEKPIQEALLELMDRPLKVED